jgi:hypothetical protein
MRTLISMQRPLMMLAVFLTTLLGTSIGLADGGGEGGSAAPGGGCRLMLDSHVVTFPAHHPQLSGSATYCTEIPEIGNVAVVFDLGDKALRDKTLEFEITKADGGARVLYQPPEKFVTGTFTRTINLTESGDYIVRASLIEGDKKHDAQLKFHLAEEHGIDLNTAMIIAVVLTAAGYFAYQSHSGFRSAVQRGWAKLG